MSRGDSTSLSPVRVWRVRRCPTRLTVGVHLTVSIRHPDLGVLRRRIWDLLVSAVSTVAVSAAAAAGGVAGQGMHLWQLQESAEEGMFCLGLAVFIDGVRYLARVSRNNQRSGDAGHPEVPGQVSR